MFSRGSTGRTLIAASCAGIISSHLIYKKIKNYDNSVAALTHHHKYRTDIDYTKSIECAREYVETERLIQGVPGITVAVIKNNKLIWNEGFGYIDIENRVLATPNSLMRVASISKSFTSAGIGLLLQQNKLDLNTTIQHYIPDYPLLKYKINNENDTEHEEISDELCDITVQQLCNHQSGIRHYKDDEFWSLKGYKTCADTLEIFKNDILEFKPGTNFKYSTYNYCVLSAIIEQITYSKFIHFMENEIFNKFKMYHTFFESNNNIVMKRSKQYVRQKDENDLMIQKDIKTAVHNKDRMRLYNTKYVNNSNKFAGGGYLSTAFDIALFANEMIFGDFLSEKIKNKLFLNVKNEYNYGLGWSVFRNVEDEIIEVSHAGGAVGGCSHMLIIPKEKLVVVILMNLEGGNPFISRQIAKYFEE